MGSKKKQKALGKNEYWRQTKGLPQRVEAHILDKETAVIMHRIRPPNKTTSMVVHPNTLFKDYDRALSKVKVGEGYIVDGYSSRRTVRHVIITVSEGQRRINDAEDGKQVFIHSNDCDGKIHKRMSTALAFLQKDAADGVKSATKVLEGAIKKSNAAKKAYETARRQEKKG